MKVNNSKKMKTEKKLIASAKDQVTKRAEKTKQLLPTLQALVNEAKVIDIDMSTDDLFTVIRFPDAFIKKKRIEKIKAEKLNEINGLPFKITPEKFLELTEGTDAFPDSIKFEVAAAQLAKSKILENVQYISIVDGEAVIDQAKVDEDIENESVYLSNPELIEIYEGYSSIINTINEVNKKLALVTGYDGLPVSEWRRMIEPTFNIPDPLGRKGHAGISQAKESNFFHQLILKAERGIMS